MAQRGAQARTAQRGKPKRRPIGRTPPVSVIRALREEVGFGCPVPSCGNPYLSWHHFDPPWHVKQHHHPTGMIALCLTHHRQADAGAFTSEQLRQFKAGDNANEVRGRLEWMRQSLLAVVGGSFYYEVPKVIQLGGRPLVWFERDEHGYMLLGVRLPTLSGQPRVRVTRNFFEHIGTPEDFECPPNGRLLRVRYADGDSLAIEFLNCESTEAFRERYQQPLAWNDVAFPLTLLEINLNIAGRRLTFTPDGAEIMGNRLVRGWSRNSNVGISLD